MVAMIESNSKFMIHTLYRSLIRASQPFTEYSSKGALLCSLLYRSGEEDESDDLPNNNGSLLYKSLLSEIIGHNKHMNFPSQIVASLQTSDTVMDRLHHVIRREFRDSIIRSHSIIEKEKSVSHDFSLAERKKAAFLGLCQLNKKIQYAEKLGIPKYMDTTVKQLSIDPLSLKTKVTDHIRPGTFLIAHPLLAGYFQRTVIMILEHTESSKKLDGGTYGLIINRPSLISPVTHSTTATTTKRKRRTLSETIRSDSLPRLIQKAFGQCPILEGGPLNFSLQMLRLDQGKEDTGKEKDSIPDENLISLRQGEETIYYGEDIMKASKSVLDRKSKKEDYLFIVGASCWESGQLENEIKQGYWLLCEGPLLFDNVLGSLAKDEDLLKDQWLSFTESVSEVDGILASLCSKDTYDDNGLACDML